ncbi:MAG: alpha/beta hydrolase [Chlorobiaceae bacterium]|nr:alpha/beta hydrolase [Chlorobiaceae bacterium]
MSGSLCAATENKVGVVLIHGKWGNPSQFNSLAKSMSSKGYMVLTPLMPWSKVRGYDIDYSSALEIVTGTIQELRKSGSAVIVLAGHSKGANAAIAYAAYGREKIDAVIAIAPGHMPDTVRFHQSIQSSLKKAREMIDSGKGDERALFTHRNNGRYADITMTAAAYFSYYDPEGMASMPLSTSRITQRIPLVWILAGTTDVLYDKGRDYVFDKWPRHPHNKYLVLNSVHREAPDDAKEEILRWIEALPSPDIH